jgi:hypothetical protein
VATTGTVAGSLTFRVEHLRSSGTEIGSVITPAVTRIPPTAASLTEACYAKNAAGGYELSVTGFSTTRELEYAVVRVDGSQQIQRIDISGYASDYFGSAASIRSGGAFRVGFPFQLTSTSNPAVNVTITNSFGASQTRQAQLCR